MNIQRNIMDVAFWAGYLKGNWAKGVTNLEYIMQTPSTARTFIENRHGLQLVYGVVDRNSQQLIEVLAQYGWEEQAITTYLNHLMNWNFVDTNAIAASSMAMATIATNTTAAIAITRSPTAMTAVAASSTAMTAIATSTIAMTAVAASSTAAIAIAQSPTAMTAVVASSTAMTALAASSIAMGSIAASPTAMAAIAASSTAMTAAAESVVARTAIEGNITAINAINSARTSGQQFTTTAANGMLIPGFYWVRTVRGGIDSGGNSWRNVTWTGIFSGNAVSGGTEVTVNRFAHNLSWDAGGTMHNSNRAFARVSTW